MEKIFGVTLTQDSKDITHHFSHYSLTARGKIHARRSKKAQKMVMVTATATAAMIQYGSYRT